MNSLPFAMFLSCRFQKNSQDALRSPALGVPNNTTFSVRLASSGSSTNARCTTSPPMLCATNASDL